jgi:hypothetical protein
MKCKYTFKIEGEIKPDRDYEIPLRGYLYDFVLKDGYITHVCVTVPNFDPRYLPTVSNHAEGKVKASIHIPPDPYLWGIQEELRTFQGFLSLFGLKSISIDNPKIEWIPENKQEETKLHLFGAGPITYSRNKLPILPLPHDLLVRALIASKETLEARSIEVPLSFYRKGTHDIFERLYIEAIYDFYFMLETLYGDGKFKKDAIITRFVRSAELRESIQKALDVPDREISGDKKLSQIYKQKIASKSIEEIIAYIVDLRGFLHHHTVKNRRIWHPDNQNEYKTEALFLLSLCFNVAMKIFCDLVQSEETKEVYESIRFRVKKL